ncbi:MAG: alpha/beta fold hydrolase [Vulcanimicrobiaceae bacterium]
MQTTSQIPPPGPSLARRRAAWRRRDLTLEGGLTLATFEAGREDEGAPVVVLVHGLGHWTQAAWDFMVPYLDATHRVLAFDLPGFGDSAKPPSGYDLASFVRTLGDVIEARGHSTYALVGHSLGGLIAADFARQQPDGRIRMLGLIDPAGFLRSPSLALKIAGSRPVSWLFKTIRPTRGFVRRTFESAVYDPASIPEDMYARAYELSQDPKMTRAFALVYAGAMQEFLHLARLHARLAEWKGPTLLVWGGEDRYIPVRALENARLVFPQASVHVLEHCGHCPPVEYPDQVAQLLIEAGA